MAQLSDLKKLVISLVGCQLAGFIGSIATVPAIPGWYDKLQKPWFTPPSWVFVPTWTFIFITIGVAAYLIWQLGWENPQVRQALKLFIFQFSLNFAWPWLFFGFKLPLAAFFDIAVLWILILIIVIKFYRLQRNAARLMLPYWFWISFASILNFDIWWLNR